jgi:hypothetical protein
MKQKRRWENKLKMGLVSSVMVAIMVLNVMVTTKAKAGGGEDPGDCSTRQEINIDGYGITECLSPNTSCTVVETTHGWIWGSGTVPHTGTCQEHNDFGNAWCGCYW